MVLTQQFLCMPPGGGAFSNISEEAAKRAGEGAGGGFAPAPYP
jgi:hypothetical protein